MTGKARFIIAGLLIVVAVTVLIVGTTGRTARYFLTIEELLAMGDEALDRSVTVSGAVLGDTIVYEPAIPRVRFTIVQVPGDPREVEQAGGQAAVIDAAVSDPQAPRLEVILEDVKPDLLEHKAQPIVRGHLEADGRLHADEVLLKCPSRYADGLPDQAEAP